MSFFFFGVPQGVDPADYSPPSITYWQQGSNQGPKAPSSATSTAHCQLVTYHFMFGELISLIKILMNPRLQQPPHPTL